MTDHKHQKDGAKCPPMAFDPVDAALRQIFDELASEDIPEDFADLVSKLTMDPRTPKADKK